MARRKAFALRIDEATLQAMQRWATDDLRSLNAQIEFVLREALRSAGLAAEAGRGSGGYRSRCRWPRSRRSVERSRCWAGRLVRAGAS